MKPLAAVVLLTAVAAPARAQQPVPLRFAPADGAKVHRLFQSHSRVVILDGSGAGDRVTTTRELADLGGVTQLTMTARDGSRVVHLTFDSLRTRAREGDGAWREAVPASLDGAWLQARLSDRLEVLSVSTGELMPGVTTLLELVTGFPDLSLPDRPVRAGDRWVDDVAIPILGLGLRAGADTIGPRSVPTRALVVVDSVVPRAKDTLVYLAVTGSFTPEHGAAPTYSGGVTARLVWSTGWRTFVSSATRVRIRVAGVPGEGGSTTALVLETTVRQQVRS